MKGLLFFILFVAFFIGTFYLFEKMDEEKISCLEPYAISICKERNMIYFSHSTITARCKEDLREISNLPYLFNKTESEACS